jgi:hypothetical protein
MPFLRKEPIIVFMRYKNSTAHCLKNIKNKWKNMWTKKLPREVPIKIAVGVANPSAHGQETTCRV